MPPGDYDYDYDYDHEEIGPGPQKLTKATKGTKGPFFSLPTDRLTDFTVTPALPVTVCRGVIRLLEYRFADGMLPP